MDWDLRVAKIPGRGRGVVACRRFERGRLVHSAPVLVVPEDRIGTALDRYVFQWSTGRCAVALGYASLLNHSRSPALHHIRNVREKVIVFFASRRIERGEELTIDYGYEPHGYDGK